MHQANKIAQQLAELAGATGCEETLLDLLISSVSVRRSARSRRKETPCGKTANGAFKDHTKNITEERRDIGYESSIQKAREKLALLQPKTKPEP
jgi:hypothetical protein